VVDQTITDAEPRKHLSYYVRQANSGRTFLITVRGEPVARLVPYEFPRRLCDQSIPSSVRRGFAWNKLPSVLAQVARHHMLCSREGDSRSLGERPLLTLGP
jgi:prevent-host-death family protein